MSLVLKIENLATGKVKKVNLKKGHNSIKLPKGVHIDVVDKDSGQAILPTAAHRAGDDANLTFLNGNQQIDVTFVDSMRDLGAAVPQGDVSPSALSQAAPEFSPVAPAVSSSVAAGGNSGGGSIGLILLGLAGLGGGAAAAGGGGSSSGNSSSGGSSGGGTTPTGPTATPVIALGTGVADGATAAEASATGGAVTVNAASGAAVTVTFTNGSHTVTKTVTGTGSALAVTLTASDLQTLGDGAIAVSATATASGQPASSAATASFNLVPPPAPTLTAASGVADFANSAEATAAAGVYTVVAEAGSTVTVTFSHGGNSVVKTLTASGSAQAVVLYRVHIRVDTRPMKGLGGQVVALQPGMTATVEIKTGDNTVLGYLMKPILKTVSEAMHER